MYASEVRTADHFGDELVESHPDKAEIELTRQLIGALTAGDFDPSEYHDVYVEKLTQLIEAKVAGKEIVAPLEAPEPHVINLMDAIRKSMDQIKRPESKGPRKAGGKRPARRASSHSTRKRKAAI